mgnify:CR=1 FL=1
MSPGFEEIFSEITLKSDSEKNLSNEDLNEPSLLCFIHNNFRVPLYFRPRLVCYPTQRCSRETDTNEGP